jgi:hypothetical protein
VDKNIEIQPTYKSDQTDRVNLKEIVQLQQVDHKFTHEVDFWLENIVVGFIIEFVVDTVKSYSIVEQEFLKGP